MNYVELILTCGSWQEAQKIADHLLGQKLVACVEMMEIKSKYWWEHKLEEATEIKLIMESVATNFEKVEKELTDIHSYKTFVLQMVPIQKLSTGASAWVQEVIQ